MIKKPDPGWSWWLVGWLAGARGKSGCGTRQQTVVIVVNDWNASQFCCRVRKYWPDWLTFHLGPVGRPFLHGQCCEGWPFNIPTRHLFYLSKSFENSTVLPPVSLDHSCWGASWSVWAAYWPADLWVSLILVYYLWLHLYWWKKNVCYLSSLSIPSIWECFERDCFSPYQLITL